MDPHDEEGIGIMVFDERLISTGEARGMDSAPSPGISSCCWLVIGGSEV